MTSVCIGLRILEQVPCGCVLDRCPHCPARGPPSGNPVTPPSFHGAWPTHSGLDPLFPTMWVGEGGCSFYTVPAWSHLLGKGEAGNERWKGPPTGGNVSLP